MRSAEEILAGHVPPKFLPTRAEIIAAIEQAQREAIEAAAEVSDELWVNDKPVSARPDAIAKAILTLLPTPSAPTPALDK